MMRIDLSSDLTLLTRLSTLCAILTWKTILWSKNWNLYIEQSKGVLTTTQTFLRCSQPKPFVSHAPSHLFKPNAYSLKQNWTHAKSWKSWHSDYDLNISEKNWANIFKHIHSTKLPNSIKWHASTIIFRTCWTGVKEFLSYNREDDRYCRLCNSIEDQNTMHKYFKCPIVIKLWSHVQNFIWLNFNLLIHTDLNSQLFHQYKHKKTNWQY